FLMHVLNENLSSASQASPPSTPSEGKTAKTPSQSPRERKSFDFAPAAAAAQVISYASDVPPDANPAPLPPMAFELAVDRVSLRLLKSDRDPLAQLQVEQVTVDWQRLTTQAM